MRGETGWSRVTPRASRGPALLDWGREGKVDRAFIKGLEGGLVLGVMSIQGK